MDFWKELFNNKFNLPQEFSSPAVLSLTKVADYQRSIQDEFFFAKTSFMTASG